MKYSGGGWSKIGGTVSSTRADSVSMAFDSNNIPYVENVTANDVTGFNSSAAVESQNLTVTVGDKATTFAVTIVIDESSQKKLDTPNNLTWDTTLPAKAVWSAVTNASGYTVQLYQAGSAYGDAVTGVADNVYDFTPSIKSTGTYTFTVTAVGDGLNYSKSDTSAASAAYNYTAPSTNECFIATAAFGSKLQPAVVLLRQFRDKCLLTNTLGRAFVKFYYHHSPPVARFIAQSEPLKALVRILLLPLIAIAYAVLHPVVLWCLAAGLLVLLLHQRKSREKLII
jgi:hypothetical protein